MVCTRQAARETLRRVQGKNLDNGQYWALMGSLEQEVGNLALAEECFKRGSASGGALRMIVYNIIRF